MGIRSVSASVQVATQAQTAVKASPTREAAAPQAHNSATVAVLKALAAAVQEAKETPAQTQKEASAGDRQAQKLLHEGAGASSAGPSHLGNHVDTKA